MPARRCLDVSEPLGLFVGLAMAHEEKAMQVASIRVDGVTIED